MSNYFSQSRRVVSLFIVGVIGVVAMMSFPNLGARPSGERLARIIQSPQYAHDEARFVNSTTVAKTKASLSLLFEYLRGVPHAKPAGPPPVFDGSHKALLTAPLSGLRVTWFGHSSLLVEVDGARFLVDPVWSDRIGPVAWAGIKRFNAPPISLDQLPDVDAVVISHDHYDHLDRETIIALSDRVPMFVVPLGVGSHLAYWGVDDDKIVELDWWDDHQVAGVRLVATPAKHFSGRIANAGNETLWSSWSFIGPKHRAFFSGDSGMFPGFEEIGERLGPFDITMLEVGAYDQRWLDVHMGPEQAVQAHRQLRGDVMMPVHWGTFDLAMHPWTEPVERVLVAAADPGIRVAVPMAGESIEPVNAPMTTRWWPVIPWRSAKDYPVFSAIFMLSGASTATRSESMR